MGVVHVHAPHFWADHKRARLATGLERAVRAAREPHCAFSSAIPVQAAEVRAARSLMLELADRLRSAEDVPPDVVEAVERLLSDSCGPLFSPSPPDTLHDCVLDTILALEHGGTDTA